MIQFLSLYWLDTVRTLYKRKVRPEKTSECIRLAESARYVFSEKVITYGRRRRGAKDGGVFAIYGYCTWLAECGVRETAEETAKWVGRDGMGRVMENNSTVSCPVRDNYPDWMNVCALPLASYKVPITGPLLPQSLSHILIQWSK